MSVHTQILARATGWEFAGLFLILLLFDAKLHINTYRHMTFQDEIFPAT